MGTCEGSIPILGSLERLFEGVLYKFIKVIAKYPEILPDLQNKGIVVDYSMTDKDDIPGGDRYIESLGVVADADDIGMFKGKNIVGRMITYIVQQMFLPENHELLKAITKRYSDVLKVLKRKVVLPDLLNIIFEYRGPAIK